MALLLSGLVLCCCFLAARSLFAETLDLTTYNHQTDAERYFALPYSGPNYQANSLPGFGAGRYYLKGRAAATVIAAYAELASTLPGRRFLYGETGWNGGGKFPPHKTHQNGLTADFMTPVRMRDTSGKEVDALLPCNITNLWGYEVRFDAAGVSGGLRLDAATLIAHLAALAKAAPTYGLRIERVILDQPLTALLRRHADFGRIAHLPFMPNRAWFPHDGHYHVDFAKR